MSPYYEDYEPDDFPLVKPGYARILSAVYHKGRLAGESDSPRPNNPYKRSDLAGIWDMGFDDAYIEKAERLGIDLYPANWEDIPL